MKRRTNATAFAFLAPSLVGFGIFVLIPLIGAVALSFFRWDLFHPPQFVGLKNFSSLLGWSRHHGGIVFSDSRVWRYFGNTFFFMLAIPVSIGASLGLAVVLNQKLPGRAFFRTVFFIPSICTGVGTMLLWKFLYNPQFGPVNRLLAAIGINGPAWLESYHWAKPAIMVMNVWAAMGGTNMILYLAALQNVPPELYEAAQIDGAGTWRRFLHVTVPTLGPTTLFITTIAIIEGFQGEFDSAYIMTRGGPDGSTTTLSYYIFQHAFEWFNVGYACSIAVVLLLLVLIVTGIHWRLFGRTVNYG
jgi:multiple sugar transport system permease protein